MREEVSFGRKLYTLRTQKNIGQKEFANYLHVSISTISNYENDVHEPDLPTLVKIADYFNVSIDYLLNRTEYIYPVSFLEEPLFGDYSCSSLLNTSIQLSAASQTDLINYLCMLKLRDETGEQPIQY